MGVGGQYHAAAWERDTVPIRQEAGWASGPVCAAAENLALTGIWSLDRPACSKSLYWLRYSGPLLEVCSQNGNSS